MLVVEERGKPEYPEKNGTFVEFQMLEGSAGSRGFSRFARLLTSSFAFQVGNKFRIIPILSQIRARNIKGSILQQLAIELEL